MINRPNLTPASELGDEAMAAWHEARDAERNMARLGNGIVDAGDAVLEALKTGTQPGNAGLNTLREDPFTASMLTSGSVATSDQGGLRLRDHMDQHPIHNSEPTFLSKRRAFLERDITAMRVKKADAQMRIAADRRLVRELTQSVRSNEDALDRLMEGEV